MVLVLLFIAAVLIVYRCLVTKRATHALWRSSLTMGAIVGTSRATLACVGWYCVEHTSGPLQISGYALAMLAWPEAIALDTRRLGPAPLSLYATLAGTLILSTIVLVSGIGLVAQITRHRGDA